MEGVPAVGALPSASWVFGSLRGVVLGWPGGPVPFLKIASPPKKEHVRSHTGNRGNEAADKLANMGAEIEEGHRVVERGSAEPPPAQEEHIDNG